MVFPGVGAIRDCMAELQRSGLDEVVVEAARSKPVLGVCLGMQALLDASEENQGIKCLGVIPGKVVRFPQDMRDPGDGNGSRFRTWAGTRCISVANTPCGRISRWTAASILYTVTTLCLHGQDDIAATTPYGLDFASVIARDNVFAVQFHPEKSQHAGLQLLSNFVGWNGEA